MRITEESVKRSSLDYWRSTDASNDLPPQTQTAPPVLATKRGRLHPSRLRRCDLHVVRGRMPSVLTGANLANRELLYLGISGDGDSASIGIGQFVHAIRRGVDMVYIVENNGVYGLTKGQFSATADQGSKSKKGAINTDAPVDM